MNFAKNTGTDTPRQQSKKSEEKQGKRESLKKWLPTFKGGERQRLRLLPWTCSSSPIKNGTGKSIPTLDR